MHVQTSDGLPSSAILSAANGLLGQLIQAAAIPTPCHLAIQYAPGIQHTPGTPTANVQQRRAYCAHRCNATHDQPTTRAMLCSGPEAEGIGRLAATYVVGLQRVLVALQWPTRSAAFGTDRCSVLGAAATPGGRGRRERYSLACQSTDARRHIQSAAEHARAGNQRPFQRTVTQSYRCCRSIESPTVA